MTPVPFDLPVRPSEAAALAGLIFEHAEGKPLKDDVRSRLAGRAAAVKFESLKPYFGSLERDPVHPSSYYMAVDAPAPLLLHMAAAAAPTGSLYPKALLIGRMRTPRGGEIVVNAVPFAPGDRENIDRYAAQVGRAFLPRPQGPQSAIAVARPDFDAFRAVLKTRGVNLASIVGEYHATLWAAIRSGWREGYTVCPGRLAADSARDSILANAGCTRFAIAAGSPSRYEELFDFIRQTKARAAVRAFDFEPCTTPGELADLLEALKLGGRTPQLIAPELGFEEGRPYTGSLDELAAQVKALAGTARPYQCTLSIRNGSGKQPEVHQIIGRAALGRFNYEAGAETDIAALADNLLA